MDKKDEAVLDFAEFVATKFSSNREGWVYSRNRGGLEHIRYRRDYTGYNHWTKRLRRAFDPKHLLGRDSFAKSLLGKRKRSLSSRVIEALVWIKISLQKDRNLPDGQINGNLTFWEEDGEYIALFQPRVGVKVLEFIRADPENPYARAILDEMLACQELSWPSGEGDSEEDPDEGSAEQAEGA